MSFTLMQVVIAATSLLLVLCASKAQAVRCYTCSGQCTPYSDPNNNITINETCASCKYVVAYGGFGDLTAVDEVGTPVCSSTACSTGEQDAYSFQYVLNSYVYTMPAYSVCCNTDLCNDRASAGTRTAASRLLWLGPAVAAVCLAVAGKAWL